ncbi:hypothetical protein ACFU53_29620 [Streptomyces sp. NPDC057474]|uniref:hypothetical protein n=1 Tax=Streptomyces sp. NPDC057474 TaxID=3346144 RepID=UPI0036CBF9DD
MARLPLAAQCTVSGPGAGGGRSAFGLLAALRFPSVGDLLGLGGPKSGIPATACSIRPPARVPGVSTQPGARG